MPHHPPTSSTTGDLADFLRQETTGGKGLLLATAVALVWANVASGSYTGFWETDASLGPDWLHLDLTLGDWAADGLLALFFLVAGMEVKRELVVGELAERRAATLPLLAALGCMVIPAGIAIAVSGGEALDGGAWAIPVATDIAFALGVLAIVGASLPSGVRVLLLSIAVVDDLLAIALIAVLFTSGLAPAWLAGAALAAIFYRMAFRLEPSGLRAALLLTAGVVCWICVHASGIHATVAGIVLGLSTPVGAIDRSEHRLHPVSAGVCVPLFALAATGIPLGAVVDAVKGPVAIGVFVGLLVGKLAGILGGARAAVTLGVGTLPERVEWGDVLPIALLGGIGYTVSLLIARLAFDDIAAQERAAAAVLMASVLASVLAVVALRRRSRPAG